jgi:hypothetical protein
MDAYEFEMKGRAFDQGDRLDKVAAGLTALQHLFDGQYRALTDKKRLSELDRRYFQVRITRYAGGSFLASLAATFGGLQVGLPHLYGTENILGLTKDSFAFLKTLYELAHQGKDVRVTADDEGNTRVISDDTHQLFSGPVYQFGIQIIGAVREFDDLLEDGEVAEVALRGKNAQPVFHLTSAMKGLFFPPTVVDETPIVLTCAICDFNRFDNIGTAKVPPDQPIPPGNYRFKSIGDQAMGNLPLSATLPQVTLHCLVKYRRDPLSASRIAEILVMDVVA